METFDPYSDLYGGDFFNYHPRVDRRATRQTGWA
jgi:hypothetical protein